MSSRDRSPVKTLSPRFPSGQDHKNQKTLLHNLTGIVMLVSSGQRRTGPPTEPDCSQGFSPFLSPMKFWFLAAVVSGLLSLGHLTSSKIINLIAHTI